MDGETADSFITALYGLAEHCDYGALHDEMIRDRIVVGIRDVTLSERLQMDSTLNLEKAITSVRQSKAVKSQQATLRGHLQEDSSVNTIKGGSHRSQPNQKPWNSRPQNGPFKPNQKPWNRPQSQSGPFNTLNAHG